MTDPRLVQLLATPARNSVLTAGGGTGALIGHSAGALALEHLSDLAQVVIPMAGNGAHTRGKGSRLVSSLLLGAHNDSEVPPRIHQVSMVS